MWLPYQAFSGLWLEDLQLDAGGGLRGWALVAPYVDHVSELFVGDFHDDDMAFGWLEALDLANEYLGRLLTGHMPNVDAPLHHREPYLKEPFAEVGSGLPLLG